MTNVLYSKLMLNQLAKLSKEDYVAASLLSYINELNNLQKYIESNIGKDSNIKETLIKYKNASISSKMLADIFKKEIKNYPKNIKSENDFNTLILVYLKENITKLCNDENTVKYYKELALFIDKNIKSIELNVLASIVLRSLKIIRELEEQKQYDVVEKFIKLLNCTRGYLNNNIVYIVYYGLNLNELSYEQRNASYDNSDSINYVTKNILNDDNVLPDSIIKHLCSDPQFKDCDPDVLAFIMNNIFMYNGKMGYEDYSFMVKKILKNDLKDWHEEAEFFDLRKLYDMMCDIYNNPKSKYDVDQILSDIKCDELIFYDVEEESYGTI